MLPIPTPRIIYWALTPKSPAPVRCILLLFFLVYLLSKANHLFPLQKNFPTRLLLLIRGELSFSMAKNLIAPNYPTYAWRTVFLPGKKTFQLDFSGLCVANCLFCLAKNIIVPNYPTSPLRTVFSSRNDPCDYRG